MWLASPMRLHTFLIPVPAPLRRPPVFDLPHYGASIPSKKGPNSLNVICDIELLNFLGMAQQKVGLQPLKL